jgi:hypothetical protein
MEEGTPELAIGDALQAHLFLLSGHLGDALILDRAQRLGLDLPPVAPRPRLEQPLRAQEAADVVGAKWWPGHRIVPPCLFASYRPL